MELNIFTIELIDFNKTHLKIKGINLELISIFFLALISTVVKYLEKNNALLYSYAERLKVKEVITSGSQ